MKPTKPATYWTDGARRIFADLAGRNLRHADSRNKAARALLAQLAELAKEYKLPIKFVDEEAVKFPAPSGEAYILTKSDGWLYLTIEDEGERPIRLHYNPIAEQFEGIDADPDRVPEPGALQPRRSALAVLALTVVQNMENDS
jgi:hypothetical protein